MLKTLGAVLMVSAVPLALFGIVSDIGNGGVANLAKMQTQMILIHLSIGSFLSGAVLFGAGTVAGELVANRRLIGAATGPIHDPLVEESTAEARIGYQEGDIAEDRQWSSTTLIGLSVLVFLLLFFVAYFVAHVVPTSRERAESTKRIEAAANEVMDMSVLDAGAGFEPGGE